MQGRTHYVESDEMQSYGGEAAWRRVMHPRDGEIGQKLSAQSGVAVRGHGACRTLFLHAGLRLNFVTQYEHSIDALNAALTAQVRANSGPLLDSRTGPLWWRGYARPHAAGLSDDEACAEARAAVASLGEGAKRMAVGHNIVPFVATRCAGAVHMIDVGMSYAYGGRPAAWHCDIEPTTGEAEIKALYVEGDEAPPDLCTACEATARSRHPHALRGHDEHGDCRNYCQQASRARRQAGDDGGGSTWASMLASALGGAGGAVEGEAQPPPPGVGAANHVKTEF